MTNVKKRALDVQTGGNHYKKMPIQPVEYCYHNKLGVCESNIIKYVTRWRDKNGIQDLEKARHYIDLLIEFTQAEQVTESDWPTEERIENIGQNGNDGAVYEKQYRDPEKPETWKVGDIAYISCDGNAVFSGRITHIAENALGELCVKVDSDNNFYIYSCFTSVEARS